jgi:P pilus assembly chaperone PapD
MYNVSCNVQALWRRVLVSAILFSGAGSAAQAAGDLLVAPTRIIFERSVRNTEVTLTNIGQQAATYRISLELKRMTEAGQLEDVAVATEADTQTKTMIRFAPRKIQLLPNQPQQVRISLRKPEGLAEGEYRVHMLFRAVPDDSLEPLEPAIPDAQGIAIQLRPIYGITIPLIIRQGDLQATPGLGKVYKTVVDDQSVLAVDVTRQGQKSVYGAIKIWQPGNKKAVAILRGVAVYPEVRQRTVYVPIDSALSGKVTVQYIIGGETEPEKVVAETQAVLN